MSRLRPLPVLCLAVWSLLLWTGRLGLAWSIDGSTASKILATVPVAVFVGLGVALGVVVLHRGEPTLSTTGRRFAVAVAVWTIGYWVVRLPFILTDDHGLGFHAVHAVLAVLSWAVAGVALRSLRRPGAAVGGPSSAPGRSARGLSPTGS